MQITEIRIKLVGGRTDRLKAFCTITFDNAFVVRDLKIIEGTDGYFVAMPSRKLTDRCPSCGAKNNLRARYCGECGARLAENRARRGAGGRTKLHADVAHPVNSQSRAYIQSEIVKAYHREVELSKQPGYKPVDLGDIDDDYGEYHVVPPEATSPEAGGGPARPGESATVPQGGSSEVKEAAPTTMPTTAPSPTPTATPAPGGAAETGTRDGPGATGPTPASAGSEQAGPEQTGAEHVGPEQPERPPIGPTEPTTPAAGAPPATENPASEQEQRPPSGFSEGIL